MGSNESQHTPGKSDNNTNNDNCDTNMINEELNIMFSKGDHSSNAMDSSNNNKTREIQNLKDLLLLNLDLIQQQHAIINEREQKIIALEDENNVVR